MVIEKPFGRDLASAQALNKTLHAHFPETNIFRIDHYLGKGGRAEPAVLPLRELLLRTGVEPQLRQQRQVTMAETLGMEGRGKFYEETGAIRDVVQNHLLQIVALLAWNRRSTWQASHCAMRR